MEKRKNRAREWKRVYKSRGPGMLSHLWITIMPKLSELAFEESSIVTSGPWKNFENLANLVLEVTTFETLVLILFTNNTKLITTPSLPNQTQNY